MSREAMTQALEALESGKNHGVAIDVLRRALAEQPAQQECNHCGGTGDVSGEYPGVACPKCNGSGTGSQPEFVKHEVEHPYDWSEWVCPNPESYLMKCCDCGLVHEAQFRVAKYQPSPSDECEVANDPDLLAQFRMRRSEQWSPKDMAYRPGGLPLAEEPAQQEPVSLKSLAQKAGINLPETYIPTMDDAIAAGDSVLMNEQAALLRECRAALDSLIAQKPTLAGLLCGSTTLGNLKAELGAYRPKGVLGTPPASKPWVGLTDEEVKHQWEVWRASIPRYAGFARAIEAKLKEKNNG